MENFSGGGHLRLIVMARRRLDGIVAEYAGNSENMLRVLSGEGGGGTVAEEVRVNPLSKELFGQTARVPVNRLLTHGRASCRNP